MMTREALDQALEMLYEPDFDDLGRNTTPVRYPLDVIGAAARRQLALMAEKCGTCEGSGIEPFVFPELLQAYRAETICSTCHGSGKGYPQETAKVVKRSLLSVAGEVASDGSFWCPNIDQAAIAVLDAINGLDQGSRMRVIVTGSRDWRSMNVIDVELAQLPTGSTIVHGCASGADAIARAFALSIGHDVEDHWPDYTDLSFAEANKARNQKMVDLGADLVLAFPTKRSRGTWDCVTRASRANLQVKIVNEDGTFRYVPEKP